MANATRKKVTANVLLNNGTDENGNVKTVSVSLGSMDKDNYDDDKALAIVNVLYPVLSKTVVEVQKVEVSKIEAA